MKLLHYFSMLIVFIPCLLSAGDQRARPREQNRANQALNGQDNPALLAELTRRINDRAQIANENIANAAPAPQEKDALFAACRRGTYDTFRELLKKSSKETFLSTSGKQERTLLHIAIENGHSAMQDLILRSEHCASIKDVKDLGGNTPLHIACDRRDLTAANKLLAAHCEVNVRNRDDETPLHIACNNITADTIGDNLVSALLARGASVIVPDKDGRTPLHLAAKSGKYSVIKMLVMRDKDPITMKDNQNRVPKDYFVESSIAHNHLSAESMASVCTLLSPTIMKRSVIGKIRLAERLVNACEQNDTAKVEELLNLGAPLNIPSPSQQIPLHEAIRNGNLALTKLLLQRGAPISMSDHAGCTTLHIACAHGYNAIVALLMEQSEAISLMNARDAQGKTPLHLACDNNRLELVRFLAKHQAPINAEDQEGQTALHIACFHGHCEIAAELIERGADINAKNQHRATPSAVAKRQGHRDIGALIAIKRKKQSLQISPALQEYMRACQKGDVTAVRDIMHRKTMSDYTLPLKNTGLHIAAEKGHIELADFFAHNNETRENINQQDEAGQTPLHKACINGHLEVVRKLCEEGANPNIQDQLQCTPLHYAYIQNFPNIVQLLLQRGARQDLTDKRGKRADTYTRQICTPNEHLEMPLHVASTPSTVAELHSGGAQLDARDAFGSTPLHRACERSHNTVASKLIDLGANVDATNHRGETPLYLACSRNNEPLVQILLQHGARIDLGAGSRANGSYKTPYELSKGGIRTLLTNYQNSLDRALMLACRHNNAAKLLRDYPVAQALKEKREQQGLWKGDASADVAVSEIVKLLLHAGAKLDKRTIHLELPLLVACEAGHINIVKVLLEEGADPSLTKETLDTNAKGEQVRTKTGQSALHIVCQKFVGNKDLMMPLASLLLDHGAPLELADAQGRTPMHIAVQANDADLVAFLIHRNANCNVTDRQGRSPKDLTRKGSRVNQLLSCQLGISAELVQACKSVGGKTRVKELMRRDLAHAYTAEGDTLLHVACGTSNSGVVELLIDSFNAPLNARDRKNNTPLHIVCSRGETLLAKKFIDREAPLELQNFQGCTPLHIAAQQSRVDTVDLLVERDADVEAIDYSGQTPLHKAGINANGNDVATSLIASGALVNATDNNNRTPLHEAVWHGRSDLVSTLLSANANVRSIDNNGDTPLHLCCRRGYSEICNQLLRAGAPKDVKNSSQETPREIAKNLNHTQLLQAVDSFDRQNTSHDEEDIIDACLTGNPAPLLARLNSARANKTLNAIQEQFQRIGALQIALKHGNFKVKVADTLLDEAKYPIDHQNAYGDTALHVACTPFNYNTVKYLLDRGAKANIPSKDGQNAIHRACLTGAEERYVKLVCDAIKSKSGSRALQAALACKDFSGKTPLHIACEKGRHDLIKILVTSENLELSDAKDTGLLGKTPLHTASIAGYPEAVEALVIKGANLNAKDASGQTPLHAATIIGNTETVELLIKRGARLDDKDNSGLTPLHYATEKNYDDIAEILIAQGANRRLTDHRGRTALAAVSSARRRSRIVGTDSQKLGEDLTRACEGKDVNEVRNLLDQGAPFDGVPGAAGIPLIQACMNSRTQNVSLLLECGASVYAVDSTGKTALHNIVGENPATQTIVQLLLAHGADINAQAHNGETLLHRACQRGWLKILEILLTRGASSTITDERGKLPINHCTPATRGAVEELYRRYGHSFTTNENEPRRNSHPSQKSYNSQGYNSQNMRQLFSMLTQAAEQNDSVGLGEALRLGAPVNRKTTTENKETVLQIASRLGHTQIAETLLNHRAAVDATDANNQTALHHAARSGNLRLVTLLLERDANPNAINEYGDTPLHDACASGNSAKIMKNFADIVNMLLQKGGSPELKTIATKTPKEKAASVGNQLLITAFNNHQNRQEPSLLDFFTADAIAPGTLHKACERGSVDDVRRYLASDKCSINERNSAGKTALHVACAGGNEKVIDLLLDSKPDVKATDRNGRTALHDLCHQGRSRLVKRLIDLQADVDAQTCEGQTPLHLACHGERVETVQELIQCNADINIENNDQQTPLYMACLARNTKLVTILLDNGAIVSKRCKHTNGVPLTPLELATEMQETALVVLLKDHIAKLNNKLLEACTSGELAQVQEALQKGADVHAQVNGNTGLHKACANGHLALVGLLLMHQAAVDARNGKGQIPLHFVCGVGYPTIARVLLTVSEYITPHLVAKQLREATLHGATPLHFACARANQELVAILLHAGAKTGARDHNGATPLHHALNRSVAEQLILHGQADINALNKDGQTPLIMACKRGLIEVAEFFIEQKGTCDINVIDVHGHSARYYAEQQNLDTIVASLSAEEPTGENLAPHEDQATISVAERNSTLLEACRAGNRNLVAELLTQGAQINCLDGAGRTPLHVATEAGHKHIVEFLLGEQNITISIQDAKGRTPLFIAAALNREDIARRLISGNRSSMQTPDAEHQIPLHVAAQQGHAQMAKLLCEEGGTNINYTTEAGGNVTALHWALLGLSEQEASEDNNNLHQVLTTLLGLGANINAQDIDGDTPLHYVDKLIKDPSIKNTCLQLLLARGADQTLVNVAGDPPQCHTTDEGPDNRELHKPIAMVNTGARNNSTQPTHNPTGQTPVVPRREPPRAAGAPGKPQQQFPGRGAPKAGAGKGHAAQPHGKAVAANTPKSTAKQSLGKAFAANASKGAAKKTPGVKQGGSMPIIRRANNFNAPVQQETQPTTAPKQDGSARKGTEGAMTKPKAVAPINANPTQQTVPQPTATGTPIRSENNDSSSNVSVNNSVSNDAASTEATGVVDPASLRQMATACKEGQLATVQELVRSDRRLATAKHPKSGDAAIHHAVRKKHVAVVEFLINEVDADVRAVNTSGDNALHIAARENTDSIARLLIEQIPDGEERLMYVNAKNQKTPPQSAIQIAREAKHEAIVVVLDDEGAED